MGEFPVNKYLAQDYRNTLSTSGSPQNLNDAQPLIPVIDIQKGFPKPNAKQTLRYATIDIPTSSENLQIATVSPTTDIYFLGFWISNTSGTTSNIIIFDATSGTAPSITGSTVMNDELGYLGFIQQGANLQGNFIPVLPVKVKRGIRSQAGGGSEDGKAIIYYIEERRD